VAAVGAPSRLRRDALLVAQPLVGDQARDRLDLGLGQSGRQPGVDLGDRSGHAEQDMLGDGGKGGAPGLGERPVAVMPVRGRAVVDQPRPSVPDEQVGVRRRAVDVGDEGVEPDDRGGEGGVDRLTGGRVRSARLSLKRA
jgi:hypothetical protein